MNMDDKDKRDAADETAKGKKDVIRRVVCMAEGVTTLELEDTLSFKLTFPLSHY